MLSPSAHQTRRRSRPRLRLGIPATLQTLHGRIEVQLLDISQSGARVRLRTSGCPRSAVLHWLTYEAYGDVVWEKGGLCGMKFDPPLPADYILQTRQLAPAVRTNLNPTQAAAKAFAEGDTRWR